MEEDMGIWFSKPPAQPQPGVSTLEDVMHLSPFLDALSTKDLRSLACVSHAGLAAVDDSDLWRRKFAERVFVPPKALADSEDFDGLLARKHLKGSQPYYKSLTEGWAAYEQQLSGADQVNPTRLDSQQTALMGTVHLRLKADVPEVMEVAQRLNKALTAAHARYTADCNEFNLKKYEHVLFTSLTVLFSWASKELLREMARVLAADAIALGLAGPAGVLQVKVALTMYYGYLFLKSSATAVSAGVYYGCRWREQTERERHHEAALNPVTFQKFMAAYRERHPFTDGRTFQDAQNPHFATYAR
jgi:hypothetical protein